MLVTGLAPILAPLVGGQLLAVSSWEGIFISLSILSALIALLAALGPARDAAAGAPHPEWPAAYLADDGGRCSGTGRSSATRSRAGLTFGALFAYISGSPFVLQGIYGLSPQVFSLAFAMNGLGLVAASQVNARIVERVGPTRLLRRALACVAAAAFTLLVVVSVGGLPRLGRPRPDVRDRLEHPLRAAQLHGARARRPRGRGGHGVGAAGPHPVHGRRARRAARRRGRARHGGADGA